MSEKTMLDTQKPLIAEFLKDHQQFSRLIYQISKLLDEGKVDEARQRARDLDAVAGPHIQYEESELYPRLNKLGEVETTEDMLKTEHSRMLGALTSLLAEPAPQGQELDGIRRGFQLALTHAEHCGTLISLMSRLDDSQQQESLDTLLELRSQQRKWTEI